jgi:Fe-S-cluster containining protein
MIDWKNICGKCERQGLCCCIEPIYVTKEEESRISKATGLKNFTKNNLLVKSKKTVKNKKTCMFLKNKLCTIHNIKPLDCRAYPVVFWSDAGNGRVSHFLDLDCPMALNLSKEEIKKIQNRVELELKNWSKEDLYRYDVCAYWKPEKIKRSIAKNKPYPFGVDFQR